MELIKLTGRARSGSGKSYARKARAAGWIPAVVFGYEVEPLNIEVDYKEFAKIVATLSHNKLVQLEGEGIPANTVAVIKSFDNDAIREDFFYSVDFQLVQESRPVKTRTFVKLVGKSEGVALGNILNQPVHEIWVEGDRSAITENVELSINSLKVPGDSVRADMIDLPEGLTLVESGAKVIARLFK